jgi:hypothetical protein
MKNDPRWAHLFQKLWPAAAAIYLLALMIALPGYFNNFGIRRVSANLLTAGTVVHLISLALEWFAALLSLALAALVYLRRRKEPMALFFSYFLLAYGLGLGGPAEMLSKFYLNSLDLTYALTSLLIGPLLTTLLVIFPNGQFEPRWTRWLVVLMVVLMPMFVVYTLMNPTANFVEMNAVQWMFYLPGSIALGIPAWRYRFRATPDERQQMKWAMYGVFLFVGFTLLLAWLPTRLDLDAALPWWGSMQGLLWSMAVSIVPTFFTLAILRYRLWDIDLIIRRTLIYSVVTALLALVYFAGVALFQGLFSILTGELSSLAVVISTLAIAALFTPLRNRVQRFVDRRFYRRKYDAEQTLDAFSKTVRDEIDIDGVETALLRAVNDTMQPESVGLWVREGSES